MIDTSKIGPESALVFSGIDPDTSPWYRMDSPLPRYDAEGFMILYGEERLTLLVGEDESYDLNPRELTELQMSGVL